MSTSSVVCACGHELSCHGLTTNPRVCLEHGCKCEGYVSARSPKACPYFDAATRAAERVTEVACLDKAHPLERTALQAAIVLALLDAYETGQCEERTRKIDMRGLGNCQRCGVSLTVQDERLERGLCPDCRQQGDEERWER